MADDPSRFGPGGGRDPRAGVIAPVRFRYQSIIDFVETQSINVSRSGMFVAADRPAPPGSVVEFEFALADGFALLRGTAEVVRVSQFPRGMGVKFLEMDAASRNLIERIVEVNLREGKRPTVAPELTDPDSVKNLRGLAGATPVSEGVDFAGANLRLQISPATAGYFVYNPLLNIRLGGFVIPGDDVPLGTVFAVTIVSMENTVHFHGKGKVVAKHEKRLGIRLMDVDKQTLAVLQAEVNRMSPNRRQ
jgi:uncharacterized protein (TIGR02266 family)